MVEFDVKLQRFRVKETGEFYTARMFRSIGHAIASISRTAKKLIKTSKSPSRPGQPPHTRRGLLRRAIRYDLDPRRLSAIAGPRASVVDQAGHAMEFGGRYKGQEYPERPYMKRALDLNLHRFGGQFTGSIGG